MGGYVKTNAFKKMMGDRRNDSDGFTYVYGAVKDGSTCRPATAATKKAIRADKRKVRNEEMRQLKKDLE